ncbi:hypothetical protein ABW20_dc0102936 [Dactylellina cionopaga]|nr:hypothetical protein ABW20_dc0102936 [Dactylellina cionopaga]
MEANGTSLNFDELIRYIEEDLISPPQPLLTFEIGISPIKTARSKPLYRYVLYCVPTYSNPTGTTLSLETRKRLVEIARKYDILLISDDVYDFLGYDGQAPIQSLVSIDKEIGVDDAEKGYTISNCSFSKLLGPGIRCGWIESASPVLATEMGRSGGNHSGGSPCQFSSTLVQRLLVSAEGDNEGKPVINKVIERISGVYKDRAGFLKHAINRYWPEGAHVEGGDGGYFVWIRLPAGYNAREVAKLSAERGVKVAGGDGFEVPVNSVTGQDNFKDWGARYLRLSISYLSAAVIEDGIKILGETMYLWKKTQT